MGGSCPWRGCFWGDLGGSCPWRGGFGGGVAPRWGRLWGNLGGVNVPPPPLCGIKGGEQGAWPLLATPTRIDHAPPRRAVALRVVAAWAWSRLLVPPPRSDWRRGGTSRSLIGGDARWRRRHVGGRGAAPAAVEPSGGAGPGRQRETGSGAGLAARLPRPALRPAARRFPSAGLRRAGAYGEWGGGGRPGAGPRG